MAYKLATLYFKNFKFFKDEFTFKVEGKNVLLYGENGSGKSSIAMGLYTLMESRRKPDAEVKKYFTEAPGNDQNLRNKYSEAIDESLIKITFKDYSTPVPVPPPSDKNYTISDSVVETQDRTDYFFAYTTSAYDHFSYRTLGEYTYRKNSDKLDLFDVFLRDIFIFMKLRDVYTVKNGIMQDVYALGRWKEINDTVLPKKGGIVDVESEEYKNLHEKIVEFTEKVNQNLFLIQESANTYLSQDFEMGNVTIEVKMTQPDIDESGKVVKPSIFVTAREVNPKIPGWYSDILHLATYFNEARLTCIGLALRLGISDSKLITNDNAPILCIDDVLLSLDMGYRMLVMKMFLKLTTNRQLLLFTHDRAFYEAMSKEISESGVESEWQKYEMFCQFDELSRVDYPIPGIILCKTSEDKAVSYLHIGDLPTSANYLRKFAEQELKRLLPKNLHLQFGKDGLVSKCELKGLINAIPKFATLYRMKQSLIPNLDFYRERLMNPFSHDDISTQIYKRELLDCLKRIRQLRTICDTKVIIGNEQKDANYDIIVTKGAVTYQVRFKLLEQLDYFVITEAGVNKRYYRNSLVRITQCPSGRYEPEQQFTLQELYNDLCIAVGYTDADPVPAMDSLITKVGDGVQICTL